MAPQDAVAASTKVRASILRLRMLFSIQCKSVKTIAQKTMTNSAESIQTSIASALVIS